MRRFLGEDVDRVPNRDASCQLSKQKEGGEIQVCETHLIESVATIEELSDSVHAFSTAL